jgi:hypothetical protein
MEGGVLGIQELCYLNRIECFRSVGPSGSKDGEDVPSRDI